jgi:isopenicillin-N epimerase
MKSATQLKEQFLIDPQVIFLNHGSFGACPRLVFEKYQEWQTRLEQQPVQFLGVELEKHLRWSRQCLAEYLHSDANDLVYIPNATHGVNIIARSILLKPGDEILSTDQEYGACDYIWEFICQKTGASYKHQPIRLPVSSGEEIMDQFWRGITPQTKVIFISHIASPTSLTLPIQKICLKARQAGIISVIDGAHAPGQIDLDLPALQADFYTGNCHKWMLSPKGAGFLYARPAVQHMIEPLIVSWGYQSKSATPRETLFIDLMQWTGTKDPAAALSVPSAIEFMERNHWDDVRSRCHDLLRSAIGRICEWSGLSPLYPLDSDLYHQMGSLSIPKVRDVSELKSRLYDERKIEIPCMEWNGKHLIRLSVQGYNSEDDINILIRSLQEIVPALSL